MTENELQAAIKDRERLLAAFYNDPYSADWRVRHEGRLIVETLVVERLVSLDDTEKPTYSHDETGPHDVGGKTNFHYDFPWPCQEWVSEKGLFVNPPRLIKNA